MYKCLECGHLFEYGEEKKSREYRGEYFGFPAYEEISSCPICEGDFEETEKCEVCDSECLAEELVGCVCKSCINSYRKDFDFCYKISVGETTEIKINPLIASVFDVSDIEAILLNHIKTRMPVVDCSQFIDDDLYWFGEKLAKEVKKNEQAKK